MKIIPGVKRRVRRQMWFRTVLFGEIIIGLFGFALHNTPVAIVKAFLLGMIGWTAWTLFEYCFHRFMGHMRPRPQILENWHGHGEHHQYPQYYETNFFSYIDLAGTFTLVSGVGFLASHNVYLTAALLGGFVIGYLHYEWVHYAVHFTVPQHEWGRKIVRNHFRHHFENPNGCYGFVTTFWDHVFNTQHG